MHAPEEEGGRATFDEAGFRASLARCDFLLIFDCVFA